MADVTDKLAKTIKVDKRILWTGLVSGAVLIIATPFIQRGAERGARWLRRTLRF